MEFTTQQWFMIDDMINGGDTVDEIVWQMGLPSEAADAIRREWMISE